MVSTMMKRIEKTNVAFLIVGSSLVFFLSLLSEGFLLAHSFNSFIVERNFSFSDQSVYFLTLTALTLTALSLSDRKTRIYLIPFVGLLITVAFIVLKLSPLG